MMFILMPRALVSANRIGEVLNSDVAIQNLPDAKPAENMNGVLKFENVSFTYPGGEDPAISGISFTAKPGQTTAFIGSTGSGKSTLISLVPRLYDVTEGKVTIDGVDVRNITKESLRRQIGYVPQKNVLFSGTIASNLLYGFEADPKDVQKEMQENNLSDRIVHMILPLAVIVTEHLWYYGYMVRNKMLDEVRADYVLLAKAKGMKKSRIMLTHCLRNVMPSYLSIMAISVAHIMGGTYVVETVFSYPGIGTLAYESARYKDYNLLMVVSLLSGIIVIVCNMAAQILNERIDPRIRISRQPDIQEVREHE